MKREKLLLGTLGILVVCIVAGFAVMRLIVPPYTPIQPLLPAPPAEVKPPNQPATGEPTAAQSGPTGKVINVVDGRTLEVEGVGKVTLGGLDLPRRVLSNPSDPAHQDAISYLRTEALNKQIRLEPVAGPDGSLPSPGADATGLKYYFAYSQSGTQLNSEMVRRGLVFKNALGEGSHHDELSDAMAEAVHKGIGVWGPLDKQSLSDTRAAANASNDGKKPGVTQQPGDLNRAAHVGPEVGATARPARNELQVAILSGSSEYHRLDCPSVKASKAKPIIMPVSEARSQGLKPDKRCFTSAVMSTP